MVPKDELTLAILAGGRGSRLGGVDKGALKCEGRTLLERLTDLSVLARDVLVIGAGNDVVPNKGAPGGLVTALVKATTPWVLAVCCDMPHVALEAARALCSAGALEIAAFETERGVQPFPALYATTLGATWRTRLELRNPSLKELVASVRVTTLRLQDSDPTGRSVLSVNTSDDARALSVELP